MNHPLLEAIEKAPLDPISDEENAELDKLAASTEWIPDGEFCEMIGIGNE